VGQRAAVVQGDAGAMPFRTGSFDRILLGDVIEHLPGKLTVHAMAEVRRVLVPGGKALIHTSPNTWFISFVRRPLAVVLRMLGHHDVLARFEEYDRLRSPMHPSELNPVSLRRLVRAAGFRGHCWVDRDVLRSGTSDWTSGLAASRVVRLFALVAGSWPFRLLLGNDLYALVNKPDDRRAPRDGR
jgi:SAM-dependent methyltransferase